MLAILQTLLQYIISTLARVVGVAVFLFILAVLLIRLLGVDYKPYLNLAGRAFSGARVVDFQEAFGGDSNIRVCDVLRFDTDGDGFEEWLVYYQFDANNQKNWKNPCPSNAPMAAAIYDNDRGTPPILFPYKLQPPDRDFLGEGAVWVDFQEIVDNYGTDNTAPIPELIFKGAGATDYMTIFKYQPNTPPGSPPTDEVPRYRVIGSFSGTGGVKFDPATKQVTVYDRGPYERSQLAIKKVYQLHGEGNDKTYMADAYSATLAAPTFSTIDFGIPPPNDITNAAYPEKVLLAFYKALTKSATQGWNPNDLVAPNSDAAQHLKNNDYAYFGFTGSGEPTNLVVRSLQYYPATEKVPATPTIEGKIPRRSRVDIDADATQGGSISSTGLISFEVLLIDGQWKVNRRLTPQ